MLSESRVSSVKMRGIDRVSGLGEPLRSDGCRHEGCHAKVSGSHDGRRRDPR